MIFDILIYLFCGDDDIYICRYIIELREPAFNVNSVIPHLYDDDLATGRICHGEDV